MLYPTRKSFFSYLFHWHTLAFPTLLHKFHVYSVFLRNLLGDVPIHASVTPILFSPVLKLQDIDSDAAIPFHFFTARDHFLLFGLLARSHIHLYTFSAWLSLILLYSWTSTLHTLSIYFFFGFRLHSRNSTTIDDLVINYCPQSVTSLSFASWMDLFCNVIHAQGSHWRINRNNYACVYR